MEEGKQASSVTFNVYSTCGCKFYTSGPDINDVLHEAEQHALLTGHKGEFHGVVVPNKEQV